MLVGEDSDQSRNRVGLAVLLVGLVALGWAWGNWAYRTSRETATESVQSAPTEPVSPTTQAVVRSMPLVLLAVFGAILVFLVGSYVLVRGARRVREGASRRRAVPTSSADVWAMHKLHDDDVNDVPPGPGDQGGDAED